MLSYIYFAHLTAAIVTITLCFTDEINSFLLIAKILDLPTILRLSKRSKELKPVKLEEVFLKQFLLYKSYTKAYIFTKKSFLQTLKSNKKTKE